MLLTRRTSQSGPRWTCNDFSLPRGMNLGLLLELRKEDLVDYLTNLEPKKFTDTALLPPVEPGQEIWAAGVTYLRSRVEREAESTVADVYATVYEADRPELFFKSVGTRAVGHGQPIRIRRDSAWNVPEPELTLVINAHGEIVGYTAGNDVSSRSIEGENPLYLPQAKCYNGSCALGPGIILANADDLTDLAIHLNILRNGVEVFSGEARTSQMKRALPDLVEYLYREMSYPQGTLLMTGTGIVPTQDFTLEVGDQVSVTVGQLTLTNEVG
jgi:2-dehydro-3-deoxy-D-arabinonate dehydratase